ncbi:permease [Maribacter sp. PR1]|uniref:Permease n=1 Tax=Maribacter cobaltidurans TaxID=1178778 RepID=A0ABU7IR24_9FLAO|nr:MULTISPECIES: permease [Maribacter]MDC6388012.1 permease [Maribacter sp. PR1]MEE1975400.1 permease [Maribacter cobaltidurans]
MDYTLQKTFTFLLFIGIGLLLKYKFKSKEELTGIKKIILNLALPATIFIALIGVKIDAALLSLPILALGLNVVLFLLFPYLMPLTGIKKGTPEYRTARLLVPSLAPGLSCFPFILEFLGEEYLAKAAMADLGNKVFVLIILYLVAMNWYYSKRAITNQSRASKLKSLTMAMISEPVNIFIVIALILVFFGFKMESLPFIISDTLTRLSVIMTPLVLLFIGLAVKIKKQQIFKIFSLLFLRAGFVSVVSGIFIIVANITIQKDILVLLSFGLSACSFWPFSHIAVVGSQEMDIRKKQKTFNATFGVNILALSFPLSTILILGILSSGALFSNGYSVLLLGITFSLLGIVPYLLKKVFKIRRKAYRQKSNWIIYRTSSTETSR